VNSKPTIKEVEEYMASLNIPMEERFNGTAAYDVISKPKHYMLFDETYIKNCATFERGIEVRDVLEKLVEKMDGGGIGGLGYEPMVYADYVQLMQYLMRFMDKNGVEDLKKARWYLDKMIESY
jgi:predicted enzyme involved in methoxymalonyl-ACP biosynthesis